jgi:hypothetical protein
MKDWLENALCASDLMQGYVNLVVERLEDLSNEQRKEVEHLVRTTVPTSPETAAALAVFTFILDSWDED